MSGELLSAEGTPNHGSPKGDQDFSIENRDVAATGDADLLVAPTVDRLIGVIDLKEGQAVHAVAGHRAKYQPLSALWLDAPGDAQGVAAHYLQQGVGQLYIADLNAIAGNRPHWQQIESLLSHWPAGKPVYVDLGWTGRPAPDTVQRITELLDRFAGLRLLAASESAIALEAVDRLIEVASADRTLLSLDYRGGDLISHGGSEPQWIELAARHAVSGIVVLDLAAVGKSAGVSTATICRRVSNRLPETHLISGGGIRNRSDVDTLVASGCDGCLIASAIH